MSHRSRRMLFIVTLLVVAPGLAAWMTIRHLSAPRWSGPVSDHFDGERFHNLEPTPDKSFIDVLRWKMNSERAEAPAWIDSEPGPPPPRRVGDGTLRVTLVNHATLLVQMDGVNFLTDPVWSERVSPFSWAGPERHRAPGVRFEELPPVDVVLVSHNHYDHMDVPTLRRLAAAHDARLVVPLGNRAFLDRFDVPGATEVDWGDTVELGNGVRVTALPSRHWSSRTMTDRRRALWAAYVIEGPSGRVYVAGDTGYGSHFAAAGEAYGPFRLAIIPVGAFRPRWFMHPVHVAPDEALRAATELRALTSVPMHYGTFQLGDDGLMEPLDTLRADLERSGATAPRVLVLEHGVGAEVE
ncbi:MAG TPA: MBL fold metallo-hydrolase [Gemmatimonadales bacterium]